MITWRTELHYSCDCEKYNPDCDKELILDQMDAPTQKGMARIAKNAGWVEVGDKCYCSSCYEQFIKEWLIQSPILTHPKP